MEFDYEFADLGADEVDRIKELEMALEQKLGRKVNLVAYSSQEFLDQAGTEGRRTKGLIT